MNPSVRRKVNMPHATNPTVLEGLDAEALPCQLEGFADDFSTFLGRLNEFPEFTEEGCNASILALEGDLKVGTFSVLCGILISKLCSTGHRVFKNMKVNSSIQLYNDTCTI